MSQDQSGTTDLRPWGYAPGLYLIECQDCGPQPIYDRPLADKRAWRCEPCARAARDTAAKRAVEPEGYEAELGALMCDHSSRDIAAEVLRMRAILDGPPTDAMIRAALDEPQAGDESMYHRIWRAMAREAANAR